MQNKSSHNGSRFNRNLHAILIVVYLSAIAMIVWDHYHYTPKEPQCERSPTAVQTPSDTEVEAFA